MQLELVEVAFALLLVLGVALVLGVWVGLALVLSGIAAMYFVANVPMTAVMATTIWSASASWTLAALPLFVWMGEILFRTRLSEELFRGLAPWVGRLPGGLVHVNVLACGIFGMVSGSSAATCATIGKIALPELTKRGYDEKLAIGSLAGSGTLGLLIPPSIIMIVYAVQAEVSLLQMFLAGFLPGAVVMVLYCSYIAIVSLLNPDKQPPSEPWMGFWRAFKESANLIPTLLLILFVFGALISGSATATECAAWGVAGALIIAWLQGSLTFQSFWASVMGATRTTAMIMLILGGAAFMSAAMAYTQIPAAIADGVSRLNLGPGMLIACLTLFYIVLGMFLDGISMIVLTMAIVLPLVQKAGFDLIWFGIFVVLVVEMAQVSPPVGFNLFVLQSMSGRDSWTVAYAALPFFILLIVAVAIIYAFPQIALFLPRLVFPA
ncbi:MAG: TRAP transporter large permease subunit [Hyphomicrobium sp.]|nr:TRAP transporter large permease subunit [Hyphomicrobium sp.]